MTSGSDVYTTVGPSDNHTAAGNNSTDDDRNEDVAVIEVAVMATILTLAVFGNLVVVLSLMMKRRKLSRMHMMLLHLSLADLFVAFFNVLPQMMWDITFRFQGGPFLCGAVKYVQLVAMYASSYVLLSTAIDRYVAICHPFVSQKWTCAQAHLLVLGAWLASMVLSIPQVFIFSLTELEPGNGVFDCWGRFEPPWTLKLYITWNTVSVFIVPTFILALLYGQISFSVWKSWKMTEKLIPQTSGQSSSHHVTRHQENVARQPCHQNVQKPCMVTTEMTSRLAREPAVSPERARNARSSNGLVRSPRDNTSLGKVRGGVHQNRRRLFAKSCAGNVTSLQSSASRDELSRQAMHADVRARRDVGISRAKIKTIKLTLTVVICYLLCWSPFYIAQVWGAYDENAPYEGSFFTIVLLLANLNSCTNPWIYMVFSDTICRGFKDLLTSVAYHLTCACCCRHGNGATFGRRRGHDEHGMHVRANTIPCETECMCSVAEA